MIVVHHLNKSRSQRVLWLLEELGVPYEVKRYERLPTMQAPPELKLVHPLGKSPVITDEGKTLAETGAIVDYLIRTYGQGRLIPPADTPERLRYTYWLHYAEGSAMPPLLMKLMFSVLPSRSPGWLRPLVKQIVSRAQSGFIDPQINAHLTYWEGELARSDWFAGDELTGADIMMSFPIQAVEKRFGLNGRPHVAAFLARAEARPAYKRALETGGPYDLL